MAVLDGPARHPQQAEVLQVVERLAQDAPADHGRQLHQQRRHAAGPVHHRQHARGQRQTLDDLTFPVPQAEALGGQAAALVVEFVPRVAPDAARHEAVHRLAALGGVEIALGVEIQVVRDRVRDVAVGRADDAEAELADEGGQRVVAVHQLVGGADVGAKAYPDQRRGAGDPRLDGAQRRIEADMRPPAKRGEGGQHQHHLHIDHQVGQRAVFDIARRVVLRRQRVCDQQQRQGGDAQPHPLVAQQKAGDGRQRQQAVEVITQVIHDLVSSLFGCGVLIGPDRAFGNVRERTRPVNRRAGDC